MSGEIQFRSEIRQEVLHCLPDAKAIWRDSGARRSIRTELPEDALLRETALVSAPTLRRNSVARPQVKTDTRTALRPLDYGRAAIVNPFNQRNIDSWGDETNRLVDVKGVGVPVGYRPMHGLHRSGALRLDEAVLEVLIALYIRGIAGVAELDFRVEPPIMIADAGYRTRSLPRAGYRPLTVAAILTRSFFERPEYDLPLFEDKRHVADVLSIELDLISIGLTSMSHMSYALRRVGADAIMVVVMGVTRKCAYRDDAGFDLLDELLGDRRAREFCYPNVQVGRDRDCETPVLIDLGGLDAMRAPHRFWVLRAHGAAHQVVKLNSSILSDAIDAATPVRDALCGELEAIAAEFRALQPKQNPWVRDGWGGELEVISHCIARAYEDRGVSSMRAIEEVADRLVATVKNVIGARKPRVN